MSAALLRQVHREASNLDIDFADINEVKAMEEASPLFAGANTVPGSSSPVH